LVQTARLEKLIFIQKFDKRPLTVTREGLFIYGKDEIFMKIL